MGMKDKRGYKKGSRRSVVRSGKGDQVQQAAGFVRHGRSEKSKKKGGVVVQRGRAPVTVCCPGCRKRRGGVSEEGAPRD